MSRRTLRNYRFNKQNNNSARLSYFFVHFFAVTAQESSFFKEVGFLEEKDYAEKCLISVWWRTQASDGEFFFVFLNLDVVSKNSAPEELVCVWLRKWVGIIAMRMKERELIFVKRRFRRCRRPRIRLRKRPFSKWLRAVANLLFHLVQCWRLFLELNSKRLYLSSEYER